MLTLPTILTEPFGRPAPPMWLREEEESHPIAVEPPRADERVRMSLERFDKIVGLVDLRMFPGEIKVSTRKILKNARVGGDQMPALELVVEVIVSMAVVERTSGAVDHVLFSRALTDRTIYALNSDDEAVELIRAEVRSAVLHELDESFLVAGERVRDPHTKRRTFRLTDESVRLPDLVPPGPRTEPVQVIKPIPLREALAPGPISDRDAAETIALFKRTGERVR